MVFCKVVKSKSYHRRYQTKYRRRREGKTDYRARRAMLTQDKNKYNTPKLRFCVRRTNKEVICQVIEARLDGDRILASATSSELVQYGIKAGLTNYAASYATGLLCARRILKVKGLDKAAHPTANIDGTEYDVNDTFEGEGRPLKCVLDVGIVATSVGNRVFGAMKGACDGGLFVPHSTKRFPGASKDNYDPKVHRERIYGVHVANYMKLLKEEDADKFNAHFSIYIKHGIKPDDIEGLYKKAFASIIADPTHKKKTHQNEPKHTRVGDFIKTHKGQYPRPKKLSHAQRRQRVQQKLQTLATQA